MRGERLTIAVVPIVLAITATDLWFAAPAGSDLVTMAASIVAVHGLVAGLGVVLALPWLRFANRRYLGLLPTLLGTAVLVALHLELAARRPVIAVAAIVAFAGLHAAVMRLRAKRAARLLFFAVALALLVVNALAFVDVNPRQHQALVVAAWAVALPPAYVQTRGVVAALRRGAEPRSLRLFRGLLVVGWLGLLWMAWSMSQQLAQTEARVRFEIRRRAPATAATLGLIDEASDWDRDGFPSMFGGGDCAPFDAEVHPLAKERPGDGVDQNCLAGDPSEADVAALQRQLAGARPAPRRRAVDRIVLITIDALRHDAPLPRTGARLGARCRQYARAYSTNPATTYATYGLFASRYPSQGRYKSIGAFVVPVDDPAPRLPELLTAQGWATGAIAFHHRFDPRLGLTRGFEDVWVAEARQEVIQGVAGTETTDRALAWVRDREPPYFLWVHYYDPHAPYLGSYAEEVAFTDAQIVRLLDGLPAEENTAVILAADHGEAFGEHGAYFHATSLFDEQIRIPLWVCGPGGDAASPAPASIVDVAPTILEWAGVPVPATFMGRSLLQPSEPVPVFAETGGEAPPAQAVVHEGWKLIRFLRADTRLLFSLQADPAEQRDVQSVEHDRLARLGALLDRYAALAATR